MLTTLLQAEGTVTTHFVGSGSAVATRSGQPVAAAPAVTAESGVLSQLALSNRVPPSQLAPPGRVPPPQQSVLPCSSRQGQCLVQAW